MSYEPRIALVGDYSSTVIAHRAIPRALELACRDAQIDASWEWVATNDLRDARRDLENFAAVWLVPASPYKNTAGALDAVRFARETRRPFLGTCGGFQHAILEFARNVAGFATADHAEENPSADMLVITPLSCSLVEKSGEISFTPGSLLHAAYGRDSALEGYHCNYGLNPIHRGMLEHAGLRFTAFDENHEVRAAELPRSVHPFFAGTLFQPERAALRDVTPPLIAAFVRALLFT